MLTHVRTTNPMPLSATICDYNEIANWAICLMEILLGKEFAENFSLFAIYLDWFFIFSFSFLFLARTEFKFLWCKIMPRKRNVVNWPVLCVVNYVVYGLLFAQPLVHTISTSYMWKYSSISYYYFCSPYFLFSLFSFLLFVVARWMMQKGVRRAKQGPPNRTISVTHFPETT